ncbi:hypothetical protein WR25_02481 [Diploscapter pachys]|uniref:Uncharacterized protein n=1 Tax=Diploscapter pachys TaxID=2018661 RepID=A0A2A2M5I8_9BILA|nr:hypothetical protein WR25_02481 [Diploscapter pachys]
MRAALAILALLPAPAMAQMHHMDGMSMPGMTMPAAPKPAAKAKPKPKTKPKPPARSPARPQSHAHPGPDHVMAMPVTPVAADPNYCDAGHAPRHTNACDAGHARHASGSGHQKRHRPARR